MKSLLQHTHPHKPESQFFPLTLTLHFILACWERVPFLSGYLMAHESPAKGLDFLLGSTLIPTENGTHHDSAKRRDGAKQQDQGREHWSKLHITCCLWQSQFSCFCFQYLCQAKRQLPNRESEVTDILKGILNTDLSLKMFVKKQLKFQFNVAHVSLSCNK